MAAFLTVAAFSCSKPDADRQLLYGSSRDVEAFLKSVRAEVKLADCRNITMSGRVTPAMSCTTRIDGEAMRSLISRLEIAKENPDRSSGRDGRCEARDAFAAHVPGIEIFRVSFTCEVNKGPYAYIEVRQNTATGEACIEVVPRAC